MQASRQKLIQWGIIALAITVAVVTGWQGTANRDAEPFEEAAERETPAPNTQGLPFDFYVLALSWSPAFCETEAGSRSRRQCAADADYGFITHGLWPQFEEGWPSFCQTPHGTEPSEATFTALLPVMPERGLIRHQWDKHGTCSGLDQAAYSQAVLEASGKVAVPSMFASGQQTPSRLDARAIEDAFLAANPDLQRDGIAISCPGGRFSEVRICLDHALEPRACTQVDRNGCQQSGLSIVAR